MKKVTKKNIIDELAAIAFSDYTRFVSLESLPDREQVLTVTDSRLLKKDDRRALCSIRAGTRGVEVKLYDKLKAISLLCRILGYCDCSDGETEALSDLRHIFETGDLFEAD